MSMKSFGSIFNAALQFNCFSRGVCVSHNITYRFDQVKYRLCFLPGHTFIDILNIKH